MVRSGWGTRSASWRRPKPSRTRPIIDYDPLGHHVWATRTLLGFCKGLTPEQRGLTSPGTYGPIDQTLAHVIGADEYYLCLLTAERPLRPLEPRAIVDFADLLVRADRNAG